jgi:hypothetical protein
VALWLGAGAATARELWTIDGKGEIRPARRTRASLERLPPAQEPVDPSEPHGDPDALRYVVVAPEPEVPSVVDLVSTEASGTVIDRIESAALTVVPCPPTVRASAGEVCAVTAPVRVVMDDVDAGHPLVAGRSVKSELGGTITVSAAGRPLGSVAVGGPRDTALGSIERLRARLRLIFVRLSPGGAVPVGGSRQGAQQAARQALARVNGLWGGCGISFGSVGAVPIEIVDPPPPHLISIGCGHGLPASGGRLRFALDGEPVTVEIAAGMSPAEAARRVAAAVKHAGFSVQVYDNPPPAAAAGASSDISVRRANGELATVSPPAQGSLSSDATLTACIGSVELEDGLQHFGDVDAVVGTLEERTLVKALDDHDPRTIDVFLVPGFGRGGRIGESFIGADRGALRNVVIVDRAAIRSNQASFTLAHELGHVLLDDPGHPDDYGRDTPSRLMDADAADASAFGPRRLSIRECERTLRQSGPKAPAPVLEWWPLDEE